jgi:hypothetical protein
MIRGAPDAALQLFGRGRERFYLEMRMSLNRDDVGRPEENALAVYAARFGRPVERYVTSPLETYPEVLQQDQ